MMTDDAPRMEAYFVAGYDFGAIRNKQQTNAPISTRGN